MTLAEAHYKFTLQMNRMNTNVNFDYNTAEIDFLLNEAQLLFIKQRYQGTSSLPTGFEQTQKRIDDLSQIVKKSELVTFTTDSTSVLEINLNSLQEEYLHLLSIRAKAYLNGCETIIPLVPVQHDDLNEVNRSPFHKPSKDQIYYNFGRSSSGDSSSIYVYPGSLTITEISMDYIMYPPRILSGNYTYLDNQNYPPQSFSLPKHTHEEIVDIACFLAASNIDNPQFLQLKSLKITKHE